MDVKLPSVSGEDRWQAHAEFLWLFCDAFVEAFVKIFVDCNTKPADLEQAAQLVADIQSQNPGYPATRDALMHLLCRYFPVSLTTSCLADLHEVVSQAGARGDANPQKGLVSSKKSYEFKDRASLRCFSLC